ncbi:hypothetical protein Tco_0130294, partial [Tanacetum coccineum]
TPSDIQHFAATHIWGCYNSIYGIDEHGALKQRYYYCDNERRDVKGKEMLFSDFLQIRYGKSKIDDTTSKRRYDEWFAKNNKHRSYGSTSGSYLGNYAIAPDGLFNNSDH